jgi:hypothetical protein
MAPFALRASVPSYAGHLLLRSCHSCELCALAPRPPMRWTIDALKLSTVEQVFSLLSERISQVCCERVEIFVQHNAFRALPRFGTTHSIVCVNFVVFVCSAMVFEHKACCPVPLRIAAVSC